MRHICFGMILAALLTLPICGSINAVEPGDTKNGYWWEKLPEIQKLGIVDSYVEGMSYAHRVVQQVWS